MNETPIFSEVESAERFRFHCFYIKTFITSNTTTKHFNGALSPDILFDIYKTQYPNTTLTPNIIQHILVFGGYCRNPSGFVECDINTANFRLLDRKVQIKLLNYANYANTLTLRQELDPEKTSVITPFGEIGDEGVRVFCRNYIFWKKSFRYYQNLSKSESRVSLPDLYSFYMSFCLHNEYKPVPMKSLGEAVKALGAQLKRGYYRGKSGRSFFNNICIPFNKEDQNKSFKLGAAIISFSMISVFNDGVILQDLSEDGLKAYLIERTKRTHAQKSEEEKGQAEDVSWSTDEDIPELVQQREAEDAAENTDSNGSSENTNGIQSSRGEFENAHKQRNFEQPEQHPNKRSNDNNARAFKQAEYDHGESKDHLEDSTEYLEEDITGTIPITHAEVVKALSIIYKNDPTATTKEGLSIYLDTMRAEDPSIGDIDEYWDDVQKEGQDS